MEYSEFPHLDDFVQDEPIQRMNSHLNNSPITSEQAKPRLITDVRWSSSHQDSSRQNVATSNLVHTLTKKNGLIVLKKTGTNAVSLSSLQPRFVAPTPNVSITITPKSPIVQKPIQYGQVNGDKALFADGRSQVISVPVNRMQTPVLQHQIVGFTQKSATPSLNQNTLLVHRNVNPATGNYLASSELQSGSKDCNASNALHSTFPKNPQYSEKSPIAHHNANNYISLKQGTSVILQNPSSHNPSKMTSAQPPQMLQVAQSQSNSVPGSQQVLVVSSNVLQKGARVITTSPLLLFNPSLANSSVVFTQSTSNSLKQNCAQVSSGNNVGTSNSRSSFIIANPNKLNLNIGNKKIPGVIRNQACLPSHQANIIQNQSVIVANTGIGVPPKKIAVETTLPQTASVFDSNLTSQCIPIANSTNISPPSVTKLAPQVSVTGSPVPQNKPNEFLGFTNSGQMVWIKKVNSLPNTVLSSNSSSVSVLVPRTSVGNVQLIKSNIDGSGSNLASGVHVQSPPANVAYSPNILNSKVVSNPALTIPSYSKFNSQCDTHILSPPTNQTKADLNSVNTAGNVFLSKDFPSEISSTNNVAPALNFSSVQITQEDIPFQSNLNLIESSNIKRFQEGTRDVNDLPVGNSSVIQETSLIMQQTPVIPYSSVNQVSCSSSGSIINSQSEFHTSSPCLDAFQNYDSESPSQSNIPNVNANMPPDLPSQQYGTERHRSSLKREETVTQLTDFDVEYIPNSNCSQEELVSTLEPNAHLHLPEPSNYETRSTDMTLASTVEVTGTVTEQNNTNSCGFTSPTEADGLSSETFSDYVRSGDDCQNDAAAAIQENHSFSRHLNYGHSVEFNVSENITSSSQNHGVQNCLKNKILSPEPGENEVFQPNQIAGLDDSNSVGGNAEVLSTIANADYSTDPPIRYSKTEHKLDVSNTSTETEYGSSSCAEHLCLSNFSVSDGVPLESSERISNFCSNEQPKELNSISLTGSENQVTGVSNYDFINDFMDDDDDRSFDGFESCDISNKLLLYKIKDFYATNNEDAYEKRSDSNSYSCPVTGVLKDSVGHDSEKAGVPPVASDSIKEFRPEKQKSFDNLDHSLQELSNTALLNSEDREDSFPFDSEFSQISCEKNPTSSSNENSESSCTPIYEHVKEADAQISGKPEPEPIFEPIEETGSEMINELISETINELVSETLVGHACEEVKPVVQTVVTPVPKAVIVRKRKTKSNKKKSKQFTRVKCQKQKSDKFKLALPKKEAASPKGSGFDASNDCYDFVDETPNEELLSTSSTLFTVKSSNSVPVPEDSKICYGVSKCVVGSDEDAKINTCDNVSDGGAHGQIKIKISKISGAKSSNLVNFNDKSSFSPKKCFIKKTKKKSQESSVPSPPVDLKNNEGTVEGLPTIPGAEIYDFDEDSNSLDGISLMTNITCGGSRTLGQSPLASAKEPSCKPKTVEVQKSQTFSSSHKKNRVLNKARPRSKRIVSESQLQPSDLQTTVKKRPKFGKQGEKWTKLFKKYKPVFQLRHCSVHVPKLYKFSREKSGHQEADDKFPQHKSKGVKRKKKIFKGKRWTTEGKHKKGYF